MSDCAFCSIIAGRKSASIVHRDDACTAFMDINPINPGHVLVVPNAHAPHLANLNPATGGRLFEVAQSMAAALRASDLRCEGVNFFLSDGEVAGQEIFHVHMHVFPRFAGDGFGLRVGPNYRRRPAQDELDAIAERLRRAL
jgi:histidine triad (HIT) family protein